MRKIILKLKQISINKALVLRQVFIAITLLPFLVMLFPPNMDLELKFHGQKLESGQGLINVYRSDDAVGYYFRSSFKIDPATTSARMSGVYENLKDFRIRFTDISHITIDSYRLSFYGIKVYEENGSAMADRIASSQYIDYEADGDGLSLDIKADGSSIILEPREYMGSVVRLLYILVLYIIALPLSLAVAVLFKKFKVKDIIQTSLFLSAPAVIVVLGELAAGSLSGIYTPNLFLNYVFVWAVEMILAFIINKTFAIILCTAMFTTVYSVNHFVTLFRGRPVLPWDIAAVGTAADVASSFEFEWEWRILALIITGVILIAFSIFISIPGIKGFFSLNEASDMGNKKISVTVLRKIIGVTGGIIILIGIHGSPAYRNLKAESWDQSIIINYQTQGMPLTFIKFMETYRVVAPEGYSDELVNSIVEEYSSDILKNKRYFIPDDAYIKEKPERILMIMNESYSAVSYYNKEASEDTMPFWNSLEENTIKGTLYVSVRGGGTCNTEFESLSGNAMGFLPANTYPYEAYIKKKINTIASYLIDKGYEAASLHLSDRNNWNRSNVYPLLSLMPFYAQDNYSDIERLRGYATDAYDFKKVIEIEEEMQSDQRFVFNVTMQNHGGYSLTDDIKLTYDLSKYGEYKGAEVYYSIIKLSDEAVEELIDHYKNDPVKTMIVMYGDHQPNVGAEADAFFFGEDSEPLAKYETPFIIWANYDIPEFTIERMSANYMSALVLEAAGYELTPFLKAAASCYSEYPVITSYGLIDKNGKYYESSDKITDDMNNIYKYRCLQYNNLFDKNPNTDMFKLP